MRPKEIRLLVKGSDHTPAIRTSLEAFAYYCVIIRWLTLHHDSPSAKLKFALSHLWDYFYTRLSKCFITCLWFFIRSIYKSLIFVYFDESDETGSSGQDKKIKSFIFVRLAFLILISY